MQERDKRTYTICVEEKVEEVEDREGSDYKDVRSSLADR
jgi:hypothetical protein